MCVALYEDDAEVMEFIRRRTETSPGAREYLMPFMRPMTPALLHLLEATKQNNVPILEVVRELDPAYCKSQDGEDKPDTTLSTHIKRDLKRIQEKRSWLTSKSRTLQEQQEFLFHPLNDDKAATVGGGTKKRKRKAKGNYPSPWIPCRPCGKRCPSYLHRSPTRDHHPPVWWQELVFCHPIFP